MECGVGGTTDELVLQVITRHPSGALTVGNDVRHRLTVHGQHHPLAAPHRVDHLAGAIPQIPDADFHVKRFSTFNVTCIPGPPVDATSWAWWSERA